MLGRFRTPVSASAEIKRRSREFHCALCHGIKDRFGRLATLTLTYEAEWLLVLGFGWQETRIGLGSVSRRCVGFPLVSVSVREVSDQLLLVAADLSTWMVACKVADDLIDGQGRSLRSSIIRHVNTPGVSGALLRLGIHSDSLVHPVVLAQPIFRTGSVDDFADAAGEVFGKAWAHGIRCVAMEAASNLGDWPEAIGRSLAEVQLLSDALRDVTQDLAAGRPTPIHCERSRAIAENRLGRATHNALIQLRYAPVPIPTETLKLLEVALTQGSTQECTNDKE